MGNDLALGYPTIGGGMGEPNHRYEEYERGCLGGYHSTYRDERPKGKDQGLTHRGRP